MPWMEISTMSQRHEFVTLASRSGANIRQPALRFGISRQTAYKWITRYRAEGAAGLADRTCRPHLCPGRTRANTEQAVLAPRDEHPAWGGHKLRARLVALGHTVVPAPSTITTILARHGRLDPGESAKHSAFTQFEHAAPNDLWQIDFKGHIPMADGGRCHPLTVLDDHSRFALGLFACPDERTETVQARLIQLFRRYGLPRRMLMDNSSPGATIPTAPTPR